MTHLGGETGWPAGPAESHSRQAGRRQPGGVAKFVAQQQCSLTSLTSDPGDGLVFGWVSVACWASLSFERTSWNLPQRRRFPREWISEDPACQQVSNHKSHGSSP